MFQITSVDQLQPVQKTNKATPACFADIICSMKTVHKANIHKEKNPTSINLNGKDYNACADLTCFTNCLCIKVKKEPLRQKQVQIIMEHYSRCL